MGSIVVLVTDGWLACYGLDEYAEVTCFSSLSPVLLSRNIAQTSGKKKWINTCKITEGLCKGIQVITWSCV